MERRAFDLDEVIDRHRFGIGIEIGELRDQSGALAARFAHAHDAAAADCDTGAANAGQRIEPVLVHAGRNDFAVERRRGVEIVIVVVETRVLERLRLPVLQHAERAAGFHAERLHPTHHGEHRHEVAILRPAPRSAHAEACGALFPGGGRRRKHRGKVDQSFFLHARVVALRLRAITAVLGTAARLDR